MYFLYRRQRDQESEEDIQNILQLAQQAYNGDILEDVEFELLDRGQDGSIITVSYKGAWPMCDNGYHRWSITILPFKRPQSHQDTRFSKWLEKRFRCRAYFWNHERAVSEKIESCATTKFITDSLTGWPPLLIVSCCVLLYMELKCLDERKSSSVE